MQADGTTLFVNIFMVIFMVIFVLLYFYAFFFFVMKKDYQRRFLRMFHNAVCSVLEQEKNSLEMQCGIAFLSLLEQLNLNYEKLCQTIPNDDYASILDIIETIINYYDSYTDRQFMNILGKEKNPNVRNFLVAMCSYIKKTNPFISVSRKDADLMQSISDALDNNNKSLGMNSLKQLSQEIATKEKTIAKREKENQRANIVSIVGIILTLFFGVLSFISI